jgi:hypothetical protein
MLTEDEVSSKILTVKLVKVMGDGLHKRASTSLPLIQSHLLRLLLVKLEHNCKGKEGNGVDDSKGAISPTPGSDFQEMLAGQGTGEGSADEWGLRKGKGEGSVTHASGIGHENVHNQEKSVISNPEQNVASSVRVGAVAARDNDQTENVDSQKDEETFGTAPEVEGFGDRQLEHTTDNAIKNVGRCDLWGRAERGVGVVDNGAANG